MDDFREFLASLPPPAPPTPLDFTMDGPLPRDEGDDEQITFVRGGALHVSFILSPGYRVANPGGRDHWHEEEGSCLLDAELSLS